MGLFLIGLLIFIYVLPGIIASIRKTRNMPQCRVVTILLGRTFIGRVVALVMALSNDVEKEG